ncbi:hypothetical protein [Pseudomonas mosselii]|uniref:hypothetical protein n=1 Tax=Pseudomonas mosselii TaxID=78327 RepID=UPI001EE1AE00|nr:hypothetical protein [Pseudomonas mosselii]
MTLYKGGLPAFCATCGSSLGAIDDAPTVALLLGSFDAKGDQALRPARASVQSDRSFQPSCTTLNTAFIFIPTVFAYRLLPPPSQGDHACLSLRCTR